MYLLTLVFIGILIYTTLEELNFNMDFIKGILVSMEEYFPYMVILIIIYMLFVGMSGGSVGGTRGHTSDRSERSSDDDK